MGTFTLEPIGDLAQLQMSMVEDTSNNWLVLTHSIEFNYDRRLELAYASTEYGGAVSGVVGGLVPVEFDVLVTGTTQADVMLNLNRLMRRVTWAEGGYIVYKPIGLSASIMDTYYRYARSPIPQVSKPEGLIDKVMERYSVNLDTPIDGVLVHCELQTFVWGTSDPEEPVSIMGETTVDNTYDPSNDNTFTIASSVVKGEGVIPIFKIRGGNIGAPVEDVGTFYIHKKQFPIGDGDHMDWREAEDFSAGGWTDQADGSSSDGYYTYETGTTPVSIAIQWTGDTPNRQLPGKVAPIVLAWTADSSDRFAMYLESAQGGIVQRQTTDIVQLETNVIRRQAYDFTTLDIPITAIPEWLGATGLPTFVNFMKGAYVVFNATGEDASDQINVDFVWLPRVDGDNFLVKLLSPSYLTGIYDDQSTYLIVDCMSGGATLYTSSNDRAYDVWTVYGPPLTNLMIRKGFDSQFRVLAIGKTSSYDIWQLGWASLVTVYGIYATIFPFYEA